MSGNARIGSTVIVSSGPKSDIRVLHDRAGRPLISQPHEPHLAALQFQRTARSGVTCAWIQWRASRTTIPSSTGTSYSAYPHGSVSEPRKTLKCTLGTDVSPLVVRRGDRRGPATAAAIPSRPQTSVG